MKQENIERYLEGDMHANEVDDFDLRQQNDADLKKRIDLSREINEAIAQEDVIELRRNLREIIREDKRSGMVVKSRTLHRKFLVAAASVALLIAFGSLAFTLVLRTQNNHQLFDSYYEHESMDFNVRGSSDAIEINPAYKYFDHGSYYKSLPLFEDIVTKDPENYQAHFYLGMSLVETGKYMDAVEQFTIVINNGNNLYVEKAQWYAALTYMKSGDNDSARDMLRTIVSDEDHFYREQASGLLKKL